MPIYRHILAKALDITWKNPTLWLFGLFVAILGAGGEMEIVRQYAILEYGGSGLIKDIISALFTGDAWLFINNALVAFNSDRSVFLIGIFLLMAMLAIVVAIIWITIVSLSALIHGIIDAAKGNQPKFRKNFGNGLKIFWPVLGLNAVMQVGLWLLAFGMFALEQRMLTMPLPFIFAFIIYIALIIIVSFLTKFAILGLVLEGDNFVQAWKNAITLFKNNWVISLEFAALLFIIFWGSTAVLSQISYVLFYFIIQLFYSFPLIISLTGTFASIIFVIFEILLAVFHWAAWILFFELLYNKQGVASRVVLALKKIFS